MMVSLLVFVGVVMLLAWGAYMTAGRPVFGVVDKAISAHRRTPSDSARPGNTYLGISIFVLALPAVMASGGLDLMWWVNAFGIGFLSAWFALQWANARVRVERDGVYITDLLGRAKDWSKVRSATMRRPAFGDGWVIFVTADGDRKFSAHWINMRDVYEQLAAAGVTTTPWREKPTWLSQRG